MDAITLLKDDHKTVSALFRRFEKAGDRAVVERREVVDRIIEELSIHAAIEEQLFYPVARATVPDTGDLALESLEKWRSTRTSTGSATSAAPKASLSRWLRS